MTTTNTSPRPRSLAAASAITAAIAALALTACGPHDAPDANALVGGAPATTAQATTPAPSDQTVAPPLAQVQPTTAMPQAGPAPLAAAPAYPVPSLQAQPQYGDARPAPTYVQQAPAYAPAPERRVAEARPVDRNNIGSVESIEPIRDRPQGSGAGAVIGGVLGAVVGNQFGHSAGRAAMTGLGAVGGAVAGNNIERNHREGVTGYRVSVRLDNGNTRTYDRQSVGNLQVGDRVHLDADSFHRV